VTGLSSLAIFSEEDEDFLNSLPLNMHGQTLMQIQKKRKENEETKIRKTKVKRKINKIHNLYNNLPPMQRSQKLDTLK
jgi:hypothetical protein